MTPKDDDHSHSEIKRLLERNADLVAENNRLLKKLYRNSVLGLLWKIFTLILILGIPFALYFYFYPYIEKYFTAFGSSYETFSTGINELPGLKSLEQILESYAEKNQE